MTTAESLFAKKNTRIMENGLYVNVGEHLKSRRRMNTNEELIEKEAKVKANQNE